MAQTLEQLAMQGDPGTLASEEQASKIQLLDPQQLYQLWEKQHWLSHEIDFSQDKEDWLNLTEEEREWFVWGLASFFIGEERVTTQFSGLVMAYEDESEEAFLTTQQVDEARHSQFFDRFYREVIGIDGTWDERLGRVREELNDAFVKLFDEVLVESNQRLIQDPNDPRGEGRLRDHVPHGDRGDPGTDRAELHHRLPRAEREAAGLRRGVQEGGPRRAPSCRLRHLVPEGEVRRRRGDGERMRARLQELLPIASGVLVPRAPIPKNWTCSTTAPRRSTRSRSMPSAAG